MIEEKNSFILWNGISFEKYSTSPCQIIAINIHVGRYNKIVLIGKWCMDIYVIISNWRIFSKGSDMKYPTSPHDLKESGIHKVFTHIENQESFIIKRDNSFTRYEFSYHNQPIFIEIDDLTIHYLSDLLKKQSFFNWSVPIKKMSHKI